MEYTYKPTARAMRYTGSIDEVIEFFAPVKIKNIEWRGNEKERYIDIGLEDTLQNEIYQPAINEYIVKHTLNEEIVKVEIMDEDEFKRYYKKLTEPELTVGIDLANSEQQSITATSLHTVKPDKRYISLTFEVVGDCTGKERRQLYDKVDLLMKYDNWRKRYDPAVLDWRKHSQFKWNITYKHNILEAAHYLNTDYRTIGTLYFSTERLAERFYDEHKDLIHAVIVNGDVLRAE